MTAFLEDTNYSGKYVTGNLTKIFISTYACSFILSSHCLIIYWYTINDLNIMKLETLIINIKNDIDALHFQVDKIQWNICRNNTKIVMNVSFKLPTATAHSSSSELVVWTNGIHFDYAVSRITVCRQEVKAPIDRIEHKKRHWEHNTWIFIDDVHVFDSRHGSANGSSASP